MYERHFGFRVKPFSLTPDPAFLYLSREHAKAVTMLEYGVESRAPFSLLTGDIGSGKTTLLLHLLNELDGKVTVGLINNTHRNLSSIHPWALSALGIVPADDSAIAQYEGLIDSFLRQYKKGRRTLLIVDEAQNLSVEVLEELRLLSNVNSERNLILQILLIGQPALRTKLCLKELHQFAQRVSVDFHLTPLDRSETHSYVQHRLEIAGGRHTLFDPEAIDIIHARTRGVPRLVNQLCDFALLYAYADGSWRVDAELIAQVVRDRANGVAMRYAPAIAAANANANASAGLPTSGTA